MPSELEVCGLTRAPIFDGLTIPMNDALNLAKKFSSRFGGDPVVYRAPGRVNLIGEHTDYNDGFVLPAAIGFSCWVAVAPRSDRKIALYSENFDEAMEAAREALKRGNSAYFPDRVVPMLPERLSADLCSLRENEDRTCLAVRMIFDARGKKIRHEFVRGVMRSRSRFRRRLRASCHWFLRVRAMRSTSPAIRRKLSRPWVSSHAKTRECACRAPSAKAS